MFLCNQFWHSSETHLCVKQHRTPWRGSINCTACLTSSPNAVESNCLQATGSNSCLMAHLSTESLPKDGG